ncbi:E3 ubiquitin-protein ligase, putative [Plasmodium sp. gorilla clade G2]|uniref:E3 ubiquitin-protein ligase, putative n=1 Tax=Plasmodium sp. gorilla clade G2 TaxID=880535 RepID=UPI000D20E505|nr:E3 ubiquitin-protein ligase, putative [Plasmodium sp. gorilla clade G2]SOV10854.1 E3 ubiquitin-protein ligase, putative [Plasmodium sp. gorilla clade G2]
MSENIENARDDNENEDRNEDSNNIFLYNNVISNEGGDSCNVLCLFLFFLSLFFIMIMSADNNTAHTFASTANNNNNNSNNNINSNNNNNSNSNHNNNHSNINNHSSYNNNNDDDPSFKYQNSDYIYNDNFNDDEFLKNEENDKVMNDMLDNILIQCLHFKGVYKIKNKKNKKNNIKEDIMFDIIEEDKNKDIENINSKKKIKNKNEQISHGTLEAKLVTLKLALNNITKSYIFFYFNPYDNKNNNDKISIRNDIPKQYKYIGFNGININKENRYIFNGQGYNISTFCQIKNDIKKKNDTYKYGYTNIYNNNNNNNNIGVNDNCLCNYTININQYINKYESVSLREVDESYLYSLKGYILDEQEYYKNFLQNEYIKLYKNYIDNIQKYYHTHYMDKENILHAHELGNINQEIIKNQSKLKDLKENNKEISYVTLKDVNQENGSMLNDNIQNGYASKVVNSKRTTTNNNEDNNNNNNNEDNHVYINEDNHVYINEENHFHFNDDHNGATNTHYDGYIYSNNCNLLISFEGIDIDKKYISRKVLNFSVIFNIKSIIEISLFWSQIGTSGSIPGASRISLISICLNSLIDIFESLLILYEILLSKLLLIHFILMILLKFLLFTIMEVRYVLIVWKANHQHEINEGWEYMQRKLSKLYKYYYGSIFLLILIFYYVFPIFPYILLILYLCWLPQILLDIWRGQRNSIDIKFVSILSLCRLYLPIYIYLYPHNIFELDTFSQLIDTSNVMFSILIIFIIFIQLIYMFLQRIYGPRYFVNIDLLPHVHNYYKTIDVNFEAGIPECVICMYDIILKPNKYCVTPCYHIFHEKCLQQWMDIKLECPTCRGPLPNFS